MRKVKSLSSGPMADIAFLLLIFFLVTTQFPKEEGLTATLPRKNVVSNPQPNKKLDIWLNSQDQIMVNGHLVTKDECADVVFAALKQDPRGYRINLKSHESASYDAYVNVFDAVKQAYRMLHDREALVMYGKSFNTLPLNDQQTIKKEIPVRVQESDLFK